MTRTDSLITVIMPCYNSAEHLLTSVTSVLNQTFSDLELIVVNDGSTDNSLNLLQAFNDKRLKIIDQENSGVCNARNNGLKSARGAFVAFLDADDSWDSQCLMQLYRALDKHPQAVLAYCGWQNVGLAHGRDAPFIPPDYETLDKKRLLFENCRWPIHAALTRRFAIEEAGFFDDRIVTSEDYLLWLKLGTRYPIVRVPEVLAFYQHYDGNQATKDVEKAAVNHWLAQQLFIQENSEFSQTLGASQLRKIMFDELLRRGYDCYWKRNLRAARTIFKFVMKHRYGTRRDWKYMLPSLLPYHLHWALVQKMDSLSCKN